MAKKKAIKKQGPLRPDLKPGDLVVTSFKSVRFAVPYPAKVISVDECRLCLDGWSVSFIDTEGRKRSINSGYFKKYQPTT